MDRWKEFGEKVRRLREAKKSADPSFTLRQFAEKLGLSATYISKMERGEVTPPGPENIKKIAQMLGEDADALLGLAGKFDQELGKIILKQPKAMADFLRMVKDKGLSEKEIVKLTEDIRKKK